MADANSIACATCSAQFVQNKYRPSRFCSDACWKVAKKAKPKNCVSCGCLFTPIKFVKRTGRLISYNAGKTCSAKCHNDWIRNDPERKKKISAAFKGSNHPNWQGGKSLLNNISNRGPNWKAQRALALKRDRYSCANCGMTEDDCRKAYGRGLDVDHVIPFHNFSNYIKANAVSNLRCVCASCHRIDEAKRGMVQMMLPIQESESRRHHGYVTGEKHPKAKLTYRDVAMIRKMSNEGASGASIARMFGVTKSNISGIVRGKIWRN